MPLWDRWSLVPSNSARSWPQLTDARVEVGDYRSERNDYQLDSLLPFGPLDGMGSMTP
jgi:hypothetical protein